MESQVFQFIGESVTNATDAFVTPAAASLIASMQAVAVIGVAIYILINGLQIALGMVQTPLLTFFSNTMKYVVVMSIALSASTYGSFVQGFFEGLESGLADALNVGGTEATTIYQVLDNTLSKGGELVNQSFRMADDAGMFNIGSAAGWMICGVIIAIGVTLISVLGAAAVIVAKLALAIMFAVGPFFILLLLFPITARFFDSWFSQVMNFTLLVVIVAVIMSFSVAIMDAFLDGATLDGDGESNPIMVAIEIAALTLVLGFVLIQSYGMAAGLAGGMAMAALTGRHILTPGNVARNAIDPVSTRRDIQSGMMTTARRSNHMVAGNTIANPAYSQHLKAQIGRNWGRTKGGKVTK